MLPALPVRKLGGKGAGTFDKMEASEVRAQTCELTARQRYEALLASSVGGRRPGRGTSVQPTAVHGYGICRHPHLDPFWEVRVQQMAQALLVQLPHDAHRRSKAGALQPARACAAEAAREGAQRTRRQMRPCSKHDSKSG